MNWMYLPPVLRVAGSMIYGRIRKARTSLDPGILGHAVKMNAYSAPNKVILIFERDRGQTRLGRVPPQSIGHPPKVGRERSDEILTNSRLYFQGQKVGNELLRRGLKPGDRFAVYMRNHPEVLSCLCAASMTGTVAVVIDPRNKGEILSHILHDSQAKAIFFADYLLEDVKNVAHSVPAKNTVVLHSKDEGDVPAEGYASFDEIYSVPDREYITPSTLDPMHPLQIIYTSGTTGMPKGVVQPNISYALRSNLSYFFGYKNSDILYTGLSLSHGNAQVVTAFPAIARGIQAVFSRKFTKSRLWDITRKYGITSFSLLGGMAGGIFNEPPRENDGDNPVRMVVSAGTPRAIFDAFEKRFNVKILEWYGAVEGGFTYKPMGKGPSGSFGKFSIPLLIDFRIVDDNDNDCLPGVKGELISRMKIGETKVEYHGKPDASNQKTRGGWLRSGDICHKDENGWLFFDHRKGDELRRHGDFISPDLIEQVIGEVDEVSDVYVYGIPAASGAPGESDLVAAVSPFPGKNINPGGIFDTCRRKLPVNFIPTYIQVLREIPKTPSEKPKDHLLKTTFTPDAKNVYCREGPRGKKRPDARLQ